MLAHHSKKLHTYVIRNGRLEPDWNNTRRRTFDIGGRAINSLVQVQGINDVQRLYQIARQDGAVFNWPTSGRISWIRTPRNLILAT